MNSDSPTEVINQHYTEAAPDRDAEDLIWASEKVVEEYGSANKAAEETKASSHSLLLWNRLGELPDDILGYVYMGKISPTTADVIRRLDSERDQRLVSIVTVEESLPKKYVELLQKEISEEGNSPEEAIESVVGDTTVLRSVTLGFEEDVHLQLWAEAGRRQSNVAELCEELIHERIEQITEIQPSLDTQAQEIQEASDEVQESVLRFSEQLDQFSQSIEELRDQMNNE